MLGLGLGLSKYNFFLNPIKKLIDAFKLSVANDGGTFEAEACLSDTLKNLKNIK